jgi:serine/threonine protein kinase
MINETITFLRQKDFRFLQNIGQGGTGKTILIKDESIDEIFVCKKYAPFYAEDAEKYYSNFLSEIKILHTLFHINVVRVFNYYLYPESKTGYILMDYIRGQNIADYIADNPDRIDDVFVQLVSGFKYLEENGILHRDIRPENIFVTDNGIVKIIDFGFGKQIVFDDNFENSVSLNWRYAIPAEFSERIYDQTTEVYFVGKLMEEIIDENNIEGFAYPHLLKNMISNSRVNRIANFLAVSRELLNKENDLLEFDLYDKHVYKSFAEDLDEIILKIEDDASYVSDIDKIMKGLIEVYRVSTLEDAIQNPVQLARVFLKGGYRYNPKAICLVSRLKNFVDLLQTNSIEKRKVVVNNLWQRLDRKPRYESEPVDDLPF